MIFMPNAIHRTVSHVLTLVLAFSMVSFAFSAFQQTQTTNPATGTNNEALGTAGTFTPTNQYQGKGNTLQGTATASYTTSQTGLGVTNISATTVPLAIDRAHGWSGTSVSGNISNIQDTRDWITAGAGNAAIVSGILANHIAENTTYPMNNTGYFPNVDNPVAVYQTEHVLANASYMAIKLHFAYVHILAGDYINVFDAVDNVIYDIPGPSNSTDFWSPWLAYGQIKIGYISTANSTTTPSDLYLIDQYEYVPVAQTYTIKPALQSLHPYALTNDSNPETSIVAASSAKYMRVHFSLIDLMRPDPADQAELILLDNQSINNFSYSYNDFYPWTEFYQVDVWSPWLNTNSITFNITILGNPGVPPTGDPGGYTVDKYQLSNYDPSQYEANAINISNRPIFWNHYNASTALGKDNMTFSAPVGTTYMRLNLSFACFSSGVDYLVFYDNESNWIYDLTGDNYNVMTPWFQTDRITISYLSSGVPYYLTNLDMGAQIIGLDYTMNATLDLDARMNGWNFTSDYSQIGGRASSFSGIRGGKLALGVSLVGINDTGPSSYPYSYGTFAYEPDDLAEFSQVFRLPRGPIENGYFSVDFFGQKVMPSSDMEMFVAINNTIIYTRSFALISEQPNSWSSTGKIYIAVWQNLTDLFSGLTAGSSIMFSVGIKYTSPFSVEYSYYPNGDRQVMFFNDIKLVLTTAANATQPDIDLQVNGASLTSSQTEWGMASFTLLGSWTSSPIDLAFTTSSPLISFTATFNVQLQEQVNSSYGQSFTNQGTAFTAVAGANSSWACYENMYIPSGYQDYNLTVTKPRPWVLDSVLDPTGIPAVFSGGGLNQSTFSIPTTTAGWFLISAHSANVLGTTMISTDNATWVTGSTLRNQETFYTRTSFSPPLASISGNAFLLIQNPAGHSWYEANASTRTTAYLWLGKVTFGSVNSTSGIYTGFVAWENGTSAGMTSFTVVEIHSSLLEISSPRFSTTTNKTTQQARSVVPLLVTLNDTFSNVLVAGSNVSYSWADGTGVLHDDDNGSYDADIILPQTTGLFTVTITAYINQTYTVAQTTFLISVQIPTSPETLLVDAIGIGIIIAGLFGLLFVVYLRPRIIKRRLTQYEEVKTCIVHKGPIKEGLTYVCPTCGSLYCTTCAQALFNNHEACWTCKTPIAPFVVSFQDEWRSSLQYLMIYVNGTDEPVHQQSLGKEEVIMQDMLASLQRSILQNMADLWKKKQKAGVLEYFNSKILFHRGDFITLVIVSKFESSFIKQKMAEFVEEFEEFFYDASKKTWRQGSRDTLATTIQGLIEKMFVNPSIEEVTEQGPKGKGKGKGKGKKAPNESYVNPADAAHKLAKPGDISPKKGPPPKASAPAKSDRSQRKKAFIPVALPPEPTETENKPVEEQDIEKARAQIAEWLGEEVMPSQVSPAPMTVKNLPVVPAPEARESEPPVESTTDEEQPTGSTEEPAPEENREPDSQA
jgi:hypothetical protein